MAHEHLDDVKATFSTFRSGSVQALPLLMALPRSKRIAGGVKRAAGGARG